MHIVVRVQDEVRVCRFFELKFERFSRITYYFLMLLLCKGTRSGQSKNQTIAPTNADIDR